MSRNFSSASVVCPFYKYENMRLIVCEGVTGSSRLELHFECKDDKASYKAKNCERMREKLESLPHCSDVAEEIRINHRAGGSI